MAPEYGISDRNRGSRAPRLRNLEDPPNVILAPAKKSRQDAAQPVSSDGVTQMPPTTEPAARYW